MVSCGDDRAIKVWDLKQKLCLYTLTGHRDFVRSVQFHSRYPLIVSASDDATVRIWDCVTRACISLIVGHTNCVMSAAFHPAADLVVTTSSDCTVRVWNFEELVKTKLPQQQLSNNSLFTCAFQQQAATNASPTNVGVYMSILQGHDMGVNSAVFHPTLPLIASCGDDKLIKIWHVNSDQKWEAETLSGHEHNVSSVQFYSDAPRGRELVVSTSEDGTVKWWSLASHACVLTLASRGCDRVWGLALQPSSSAQCNSTYAETSADFAEIVTVALSNNSDVIAPYAVACETLTETSNLIDLEAAAGVVTGSNNVNITYNYGDNNNDSTERVLVRVLVAVGLDYGHSILALDFHQAGQLNSESGQATVLLFGSESPTTIPGGTYLSGSSVSTTQHVIVPWRSTANKASLMHCFADAAVHCKTVFPYVSLSCAAFYFLFFANFDDRRNLIIGGVLFYLYIRLLLILRPWCLRMRRGNAHSS